MTKSMNIKDMIQFGAVVVGLIPLLSCRAPALPTGPRRMQPASASSGEGGKYQCKDVTGSTDPWLVEWEPSQKVRLQSKSKKGVLLVKYEGCDLTVLYGCEVEGGYNFIATTRSRQTEYINSEDDLFAKLPIGALKLATEFKQGDRWSLDYVLVGTQETSVEKIDRADLKDRCAEATHFVQGMAVGAYELGSAAHRKGGVEATFYGAGAGASSGGEAGLLRQDGRYEKCTKEETDAADSGCQAVVQLFLQPVTGALPEPIVACPEGTEYRDGKCIRTDVVNETRINCPLGTALKNGQCVKTEVVTETQIKCPDGSRFVEGQGCVGQSLPTPVSSTSPTSSNTGASSARSDEVRQPGTGLYWLRCPVGQTWNGSSCSGEGKEMSWSEAESACPSGYRLPTRQEFVDLLGGCDSDVLSGKFGYCKRCESGNCRSMFPSDTRWYWSSSPHGDSYAWNAFFGNGSVNRGGVGYDISNVRCVRSGP
jgi:hypothetical protein